MNILENKRIIGVSAAFLLAFGATAYYGFSRGQDYTKAAAQIKKDASTMDSFNSGDLKPNQATLDAIVKATKRAKKASADVAKVMRSYSAFCVGESKEDDPVKFERRVGKAIEEISNLAQSKGCTLGEPAKKLGMAAFTSATTMNRKEVPFRRFQLGAAERVVTTIINSGASSVEKVYCAPLPENYEELQESENYFPLAFEVAFTTKRSMVTDGKTPDLQSPLPRILNAVCADKNYFLIPTGIAISTPPEFNPTPTDAYRAPAPAAASGQNFGEEEAREEKPEDKSQVIATLKTGSKDSLIRVHINFQVLYFTGQKS